MQFLGIFLNCYEFPEIAEFTMLLKRVCPYRVLRKAENEKMHGLRRGMCKT